MTSYSNTELNNPIQGVNSVPSYSSGAKLPMIMCSTDLQCLRLLPDDVHYVPPGQ